MSGPPGNRDFVELGRITGVHGVTGWVKIRSYTDDPADIFSYVPWYLDHGYGPREIRVAAKRTTGGLATRLEGVEDRDQAGSLVGAAILIRADQLPALPPGEYYWRQLLGMRVVTLAGADLGVVSRLMETGGNDVLVVTGDRERLIPYVEHVIKSVDIAEQEIRVDWDPDY